MIIQTSFVWEVLLNELKYLFKEQTTIIYQETDIWDLTFGDWIISMELMLRPTKLREINKLALLLLTLNVARESVMIQKLELYRIDKK